MSIYVDGLDLLPGVFHHVRIYGSGEVTIEDAEGYEVQIATARAAADVREVVYCRDCAFFKPQQKSKRWSNKTPMCTRSATIKMPPDGFCSFGVKREES